jgi:hypothetical protein
MHDRRSLSASILSRYFTDVKILKEYLSEILCAGFQGENFEPHPTDPKSYVALLNDSYIGLRNDILDKEYRASLPMVDMHEARVHISHNWAPGLLQLGYRESTGAYSSAKDSA